MRTDSDNFIIRSSDTKPISPSVMNLQKYILPILRKTVTPITPTHYYGFQRYGRDSFASNCAFIYSTFYKLYYLSMSNWIALA